MNTDDSKSDTDDDVVEIFAVAATGERLFLRRERLPVIFGEPVPIVGWQGIDGDDDGLDDIRAAGRAQLQAAIDELVAIRQIKHLGQVDE
jgi:hypothetical protein